MSGEKRIVREPLAGGQLVPPAFIREMVAGLGQSHDQLRAWQEARDRREAARWAALTPWQRTVEQMQRRRASLRYAISAKRQALGLRIAGLTEDDIGGDW